MLKLWQRFLANAVTMIVSEDRVRCRRFLAMDKKGVVVLWCLPLGIVSDTLRSGMFLCTQSPRWSMVILSFILEWASSGNCYCLGSICGTNYNVAAILFENAGEASGDHHVSWYRWVQVGAGEYRWVHMSTGGYIWVQVGTGRYRWVQMSTDEYR